MKMDLLQEIRNYFAASTPLSAYKIKSLPAPYDAWVVQINKEYGVTVPLPDGDIIVSERFSNARLWSTSDVNIGGRYGNWLLLTCQDPYYRNEFATLCAQFVDPGENGKDRKALITSPQTWWNKWSYLLGNSISNNTSYSVLGELITVRKLIHSGEKAEWTGGAGGVNDVLTENSRYEVKSTAMRYEETVTISGQFQLEDDANKPLYLIFCRFEPNSLGESIDDVVSDLINLGIQRSKIEEDLEHLGLELGSSARKEKYRLIEMRKYKVDYGFPMITKDSFKDGKYPEAVKQFTYRLSLAGIPFEDFM